LPASVIVAKIAGSLFGETVAGIMPGFRLARDSRRALLKREGVEAPLAEIERKLR
jgi:hypothetical protein